MRKTHPFPSQAKTARTTSEVSDWISTHGFAPPIILDVQVASVAAEATARNWARLAAPLQPKVAVFGGDACAVARVSHAGAADAYGSLQTPVTYVENTAARGLAGDSDFAYTVADYGAYVEKIHAHTTASNDWKWGANWDHFMDDHVGFQYRGSSDCSNDTVALLEYFDSRLRADGVAVGQRTDATEPHAVHYYSGKWGAMTWEFNVIGCDAASLDNDAGICACNRENNDNIWALETGTACESTC